MKRFTFLPLLFLCAFAFGQKQFVVQGGTAESFETLTEAIEAASAGDTIYIPGGGFTAPGTIEKQLHWRGVGHYPDSTTATGHTQITNALMFNTDCDGSTFEGIYFSSSIQFGTAVNEEVTDISIKYCRTGYIYLRYNADLSNGYPKLNFRLHGSVVTHLEGFGASNCLIENNLIFGQTRSFHYSIFNHNSFNYSDGYNRLIRYCSNCQFKNNVIGYSYGADQTYNCNFQNNVYQADYIPHNATSTNTGSGNIRNTGTTNLYTTITGEIRHFSYDNDYHLGTATGTDEDGNTDITLAGTATDGTNPGIYGGLGVKPYKEGAVPYSPHIRSVTIANEAVNGELDVKVTVAAQEK